MIKYKMALWTVFLHHRTALFLVILCSAVSSSSSSSSSLSAAAAATASPECVIDNPQWEDDDDDCSLYWAPSSIPHAGWGVYTSKDLYEGDSVGSGDLYVPILDHFKALPFRGQQRFLSWLGYIWPKEYEAFYWSTKDSFPPIPWSMYGVQDGLSTADSLEFYDMDEERISAFAPGLPSMVNSKLFQANLHMGEIEMEDDFIPGQHSYSYAPMEVSVDVSAGSELFLDYGRQFHTQLQETLESPVEFDPLQDYLNSMDFSDLPTEEQKRAQMNSLTRRKDWQTSFLSPGDRGHESSSDKRRLRDVLEEQATTTDTNSIGIQHNLDWLQEHGICIDKLRVGPSQIPNVELGAFANRFLKVDTIVAPAPLLALKRDDLTIYASDEHAGAFRNMLDLTKPIGQELLTNFCFSHPDSDLLLIPYSPTVNAINHSPNPNVEIRWPSGKQHAWTDQHPVDILDMSGKLRMEFVALRDIFPGDEITMNYGREWSQAWKKFQKTNEEMADFRHPIGVPKGFYPDKWLHTGQLEHQVKNVHKKLAPGELQELRWAHNGKPVVANGSAYRLGLPKGLSQRMRLYSEKQGIVKEYEQLLKDNTLPRSDDWYVLDSASSKDSNEWFVHRFNSNSWNFNVHYIAAWNEHARKDFWNSMQDFPLESIGAHFRLDNLTCWHLSYIGVSESDNSFTHSDVYGTTDDDDDDVSFNMIWPIITVNGSKPELDIQSDDANIVISVHYEEDVAILMGDYGYHKTSPIDYEEEGQMRVVVGMYCSQISDTNRKLLAHIYDGEDPAPFMAQFDPPIETHWTNKHEEEKV